MRLIIMLIEVSIVISNSEYNFFQKVISVVTNAICSVSTVGMCFLFLLCIMVQLSRQKSKTFIMNWYPWL